MAELWRRRRRGSPRALTNLAELDTGLHELEQARDYADARIMAQ